MGMYDTIGYNCFWCGEENGVQTKVLGNLTLTYFEKGDDFYISEDEEFYNCVFLPKGKCKKCEKQTAIIIKNSKFVGVENPEQATIIEGHWGNYEVNNDELTDLMKEKLKKIEDEEKIIDKLEE
ncbi:hypothetical protein LCGC14_1472760 [marine sediment metagenome]|uniref:Uncharacterized protein n=1 Tax=marine sediment metagenome TaxID=412755 RepID=A0A0F9JCL0_9ZZZZ